MATLERIRNKAGILVAVFIGFALVAFVLTDLLNSGSSLFRRANMEIAEINGTSVSIQEYQQILDEYEEFAKLQSGRSSLNEQTTFQLRDQAWRDMIDQVLLGEKYENLGLSVTSDELLSMITGKDVHPMIRQLFTNPQTGAFDQAQLANFLRNKKKDPTANFFWQFNEKQITKERLNSKYTNLLKKGMYVTKSEAELEANSKNKQVNFDFAVVRYNAISDSLIAVSDSEIKSYYNNFIDRYKRDASRDIEYLSFEVKPSDEDRAMAEEWVSKAKDIFGAPETDAAQYVKMNSDVPYVDRNLKYDQLSTNLQDFVSTAKEGYVYGPYLENETYKLTRLVAIKQLPDSVKARHILIRNNTPERNEAIADSLMNLINKGADFAKLAREFSEDPGSAVNGGDLSWFAESAMVKPFNDACFNGKKGDVVKVKSQFGIHLINIQDKGKPVTKYNLATLERKITYSSKTYQHVYSQVTKFAALNNTQEKFNEAITNENLIKRYGRNLKANDRRVGSLESPRELVKWAFEATVGDMSDIYEFGDEFVVAILTDIKEEGHTPLASVKNQIKRELLKEKKAEYIIADINKKQQASDNMTSLAQKLNTTVQNASNIAFEAYQVPGAGIEPSLIALAVSSEMNKISAPVAGNNGVFVVKVTNVSDRPVDLTEEKKQLQQNVNFAVDYRAFEAIRKDAEIVDQRSKFY